MTANGRKRPLKSDYFSGIERPLSGKADIQHEAKSICAALKWAPKWAQRKLEFRRDAYPLLGMNPGRMQGEFDIGHGAATGDRCDNQQHAGLAVRVVSAKAWA